MGDIYKAQDSRLNRYVAIKVLSSANAGDPERRRRFIQEAQAASGLNHPNIITIHDIVNEPDGDYMVMEFVSGIDSDGTIVWNGTPVSGIDQLEGYFRNESVKDPQPEIHLRPDRRTKYDVVARVLAAAQRNRMKKIGFVNTAEFAE